MSEPITLTVTDREMAANTLPMFYHEVGDGSYTDDGRSVDFRIGAAINYAALYLFRDGEPTRVISLATLINDWVAASVQTVEVPS